jgi:predicted kinase
MAECIILMGLQGAGKTTFYWRRFAESHVHVSMDLFPNARHKANRLASELTRALDAGRSVVVDNTNPTVTVRAPLIRMARARGAEVIGYYIEATTREAVARNRAREGKARIPEVGIFATAKRFQPPLRAEGFHRLYRVCVRDEGAFAVAEWAGDMSRFREHSPVSEMGYRVYVPTADESRRDPWPLIVFLHGRAESGRDNISQTTAGLGPAIVRQAERWPFLAVFPQKPDADAGWDTHREALRAIVEQVREHYRFDPRRRYLTGVGQGARETWAQAVERPADWTALAPIDDKGGARGDRRADHAPPVWTRVTSESAVEPDVAETAYDEPDLPAWLLRQTRTD